MTQTWLFAHWPLAPESLVALVPSALELDLFEGKSWFAVAPLHMTNVASRHAVAATTLGVSELNVRTYVRVHGRPGVYFLSLEGMSTLRSSPHAHSSICRTSSRTCTWSAIAGMFDTRVVGLGIAVHGPRLKRDIVRRITLSAPRPRWLGFFSRQAAAAYSSSAYRSFIWSEDKI
jgi:Uncharacterized conserved protein (COG2071)